MSGQPVKQWEKASTGSGVVYYVNHADKKTQWEHPNYQVMLEMLDDCNSIKYAAYRTAAKLCVLQRFFSMNLVPVKIIAGVFDKHQMRTTENNLELSSSELEDIIYDILFATHTSTPQQSLINVDLNTELILNFLLSVFDSARRKSVRVLCSKVVLTILCASSMQSKIHYLFEQLSDHNHCISKRKMECFLQCCSALMYYLAESLAFSSSLIKPALRACFQGNDKFVGLTEDAFVRWFLSEPRIVLWFPIFYRLKTAENEVHPVTCSTCKTNPIRGLRYKCLRCISYDQCQNCFFTRRISRRHKRSTFEYLKTLIKRICGHESRLQYLPVEPSDFAVDKDTAVNSTEETQMSNHTSLSSMKPDFELSSIIGLLESENKRLEKEMRNIDSDYLREHKDQIRTQIQRLRKVKTHINLLCSQPARMSRMQSTPVIQYNRGPSFENLLSPIAASDTSTSGISSPGTLSPHSRETAGSSSTSSILDSRAGLSSTFSLIDSRVTPDDISTWIGKKNLSQSRDRFDFSALLCPKQVSASYRVLSDDLDKENVANEVASRGNKSASRGNKSSSRDKSASREKSESRDANSSFSLDEVLAQYECDSRFSTTTKSSTSLAKRAKSLFDISGKSTRSEKRQALSTLDLENSIPCDRLKNESRMSYASCYSQASLLSGNTRSNANSCENLPDKSMGSEDYLESIRKTCTNMFSLENSAGRQSQSVELRNISRNSACPERIRRRQSGTPDGNISCQTLPRMFRTPLQNSSAHMNAMNSAVRTEVSQRTVQPNLHQMYSRGSSNGSPNEQCDKLPKTEQYGKRPNLSKSSESLLVNSKLTMVPQHSLSSTIKSCSYRDLSQRQKKGEGLCDSLNSLLSQDGVIERSIRDSSGEVVVQDEQLFLLQDEIDNILVKLKTILGSV
ncbi:hypothetical protein M8J75_003982 [Diaphorina citri]|nr:hypothetical protein M8J75_003982 [Diaphorina citri]